MYIIKYRLIHWCKGILEKIVSEIVPVLHVVVFSRLCAINLCVKKGRYIKKSFCFGLSLIGT